MIDEEADVFAMAVGEACKNALDYSKNNDEEIFFELVLILNDEKIIAEVANQGAPIDFDRIEPFDKNQDFMQYKEGGLGLPIIKKFMDEVHYKRENEKNILSLVKYISHRDK